MQTLLNYGSGFLAGAVFTPAVQALGGVISKKLVDRTCEQTFDNSYMATAAGTIASASILVALLDNSSFMTGFKVAAIGWSFFSGLATATLNVNEIIDKMKLYTGRIGERALIVSACAGILIAASSALSFPAYPVITCAIAGVGTHLITRILYDHEIGTNFSQYHGLMSANYKPAKPETANN